MAALPVAGGPWYIRPVAAANPLEPETSSIQQLKKTLAELEAWQASYDRGEVDTAPDRKLLEQIRTILTRRRKQTTRRVQTDGAKDE